MNEQLSNALLQRIKPKSSLLVSCFILLLFIAIPSWIIWDTKERIQEFQEQINSLKEDTRESKQLGDNENLTLEKDLVELEKDRLGLESSTYIALFQALGGITIFLGFYLTWRSQESADRNASANLDIANKTLDIANKTQTTHRFTEAVNQIGNEKAATRLGGIYALDSIATESPHYSWPVAKILAGFIRDQSPHLDTNEPKSQRKETREETTVKVDIQTALDIIGTILRTLKETEKDKQKHKDSPNLDLSFTNLSYAKFKDGLFEKVIFKGALLEESDFFNAQLDSARFTGATLKMSDFRGAELKSASFREAKLTGVKFEKAKLKGVNFKAAEFTKVDFTDVKLENAVFIEAKFIEADKGTSFRDADLTGADFTAADLTGADFTGAQATLTVEQIKKAKNWQQAKYDEAFWKKLNVEMTSVLQPTVDLPEELSIPGGYTVEQDAISLKACSA